MVGCMHPVRFAQPPQWAGAHETVAAEHSTRQRFSDTLRIPVGSTRQDVITSTSAEPQASSIVDSAVLLCQQGDLRRAQQILLGVIESAQQDDSLRWEALYQLGDCWAIAGELEQALRILGEVAYRSSGVPADIHARSIVRLGQILCVLGRRTQADEQFARLRQYYPTSPYRAVADCSVIR